MPVEKKKRKAPKSQSPNPELLRLLRLHQREVLNMLFADVIEVEELARTFEALKEELIRLSLL